VARLKAFGAILLGISVLLAMAVLVGLFFVGVVRVSAEAFFYSTWVYQSALLLCIFLFLPLSLFHRTRMIASWGFFAASYAFGICLWIFCLIATWNYWGMLAVFAGMVIAGIGVVPLAIIASAFNSDWTAVIVATIGLILTFGSRGLALWLAAKVDSFDYDRRLKIIDA
jgi:hypothetical protein